MYNLSTFIITSKLYSTFGKSVSYTYSFAFLKDPNVPHYKSVCYMWGQKIKIPFIHKKSLRNKIVKHWLF